MPKRFTDTNKYKKPFIRGLKGPYKLLWDYLYHDCDHAGIWIVDFEIAQIYIGDDMPINKEAALKYFNNGEKRIIEIHNGSKWFVPDFVEFQYGELQETNRAHNSVIAILRKYNLLDKIKNKGHISSLEGAKDKDKDKDKNKEMDKDKELVKNLKILPEFYDTFLLWLKYKRSRGEAYKNKTSTTIAYKHLLEFSNEDPDKAIKVIEQSIGNNWAGLFGLKEQTTSKTGSRSFRKDRTKYIDQDSKL